MADKSEMLSEEECKILIMALAEGQGTFTEAEVQKVMDWAVRQRVGAALLEGSLKGKLVISVKGGELLFKKRR